MRLTAFEVQRYGPFEHQRLEFDPRPGVINLVVAPNGAGKTVLLRAICDLLFGIPARSPMDFRHGYAAMRLLAEAVDAEGAPFRFGRRKGQGNTLIDAAGAPLPPESLRRVLGAVDQPLLERLFVLGTERLRQGGEELLQSGGALGEALQAAAGGLREAHRLKEWLGEERDKLAPSRMSRTRPFYQGLEALKQARGVLQQEIWRPEKRAEQAAAVAAAEARLAAARAAAVAAQAEMARLERLQATRPLLAAAEAARNWLAAHPGAPLLGSGFAQRFHAARQALALAGNALAAAERQRVALAAELPEMVPDAALLAEAAAIASLAEELAGAEQADRALPQQQASLDEARAGIARLLHQLGLEAAPAEAALLLPPSAELATARHLIGAAAGLARAAEEAEARRAAAARALAAARQALAETPPAEAESGLAALRREVGEDPAAALQAAELALTKLRAGIARALAEAAPWPGSAAALRDLPVPALASFERLSQALEAARREHRSAAEAAAALRAGQAEAAARLASLTARAGLPEAAALAAAREHRDAGWRLVRQQAFTATLPAAEAIAGFAGTEPLDFAFDRALRAADALADRMAAEAGLLGQAQAIRDELAALALRLAASEAQLAARATDEAAAAAAWAMVCQPLGLPAGASLAEARAVLAAREKLIAGLEREAEAAAALAALQSRHQGWAARLALALGQPPAPLPQLLDAADLRLAEAMARARRRTACETELRNAEREALAADDAAAAASRRLAEWQAQWQALLARLRRPAAETPTETAAVLDLLAQLGTAVEAEAQAAAQLGAGQRLVAQFHAAALPLLARLGGGAAPYDGLRALRARVAAAERLAARRALVERQVAAADAELAGLRAAQAAAAAGFESLCAALDASDAPAAEARLALAEQRQRQEEALEAALAGLRQAASGREEASLAAEAAMLPPEALEAALAAAGEAARAAADAADAASREAGSLRAEIDRREAAIGAIAAKADEQAAAALLGRTLEEALVLQLAGSLLADALKAVEEVDSPALLQRLSRVYHRLTLGVAQQVLTEEAGGGALELRVVEAPQDGRKPVAALSEGSRDQLFLALRLIAIEDHVAAAPPLPFIADDILQSFDDERALAAFEALLGLSHKVQVVLLTHHEHLVEVAGRLPAGSVALQRLVRPALFTG